MSFLFSLLLVCGLALPILYGALTTNPYDESFKRAKKWHKKYQLNLVDELGNPLFDASPFRQDFSEYDTNPHGENLFHRVYPKGTPTAGDTIPLTARESLVQPAVEVVATSSPQPVVEPVVEVVEGQTDYFWNNVYPPYQIDQSDLTKQVIVQALELGISQNQICTKLFQVSKGSKPYYQAVELIKAIQKEMNS